MCPEECYELPEKDDKCRRNTKKRCCVLTAHNYIQQLVLKANLKAWVSATSYTLKVERKAENCSPKANLIFECSLNANRKQLRIFAWTAAFIVSKQFWKASFNYLQLCNCKAKQDSSEGQLYILVKGNWKHKFHVFLKGNCKAESSLCVTFCWRQLIRNTNVMLKKSSKMIAPRASWHYVEFRGFRKPQIY